MMEIYLPPPIRSSRCTINSRGSSKQSPRRDRVAGGREPVARGREPVARGHEPVARGREPVARGHERVVCGRTAFAALIVP
jgi:hypothetical protein